MHFPAKPRDPDARHSEATLALSPMANPNNDMPPEVEIDGVAFALLKPDSPALIDAFLKMGRPYNDEIDDALGETTPAPTVDRWFRSIVDKQGDQDRWLFLLDYRSSFAGFAYGKLDRDDRPGWGYIMEFYVIPDRRRLGFGRRMFERIKTAFASADAGRIWLTTNAPARPFWRSLGFQPTGDRGQNGLDVLALEIGPVSER